MSKHGVLSEILTSITDVGGRILGRNVFDEFAFVSCRTDSGGELGRGIFTVLKLVEFSRTLPTGRGGCEKIRGSQSRGGRSSLMKVKADCCFTYTNATLLGTALENSSNILSLPIFFAILDISCLKPYYIS